MHVLREDSGGAQAVGASLDGGDALLYFAAVLADPVPKTEQETDGANR